MDETPPGSPPPQLDYESKVRTKSPSIDPRLDRILTFCVALPAGTIYGAGTVGCVVSLCYHFDLSDTRGLDDGVRMAAVGMLSLLGTMVCVRYLYCSIWPALPGKRPMIDRVTAAVFFLLTAIASALACVWVRADMISTWNDHHLDIRDGDPSVMAVFAVGAVASLAGFWWAIRPRKRKA